MALEFVNYKAENGIGIIELNRPPVNALNSQIIDDIGIAHSKLSLDPATKCIILVGNGKNFAAGADIKEIAGLAKEGSESVEDFSKAGHKVFRAMELGQVPVIACVSGFCLGGGCELAMACHIRIADETAVFGQPEIKLGIIPGFGGTLRLPRLVGRAHALQLLLTGESINAAQARAMGLCDVVAPAGTDARTLGMTFASQIAKYSAPVIRGVLRAMGTDNESLDAGIKREAQLFGAMSKLHDMKEGFAAFIEKRQPNFQNK